MAICPNCGSNIEEDFGLVSCAKCGASVFIELDGTAQNKARNNYSTSENPETMEIVSDVENFQDLGAHTQKHIYESSVELTIEDISIEQELLEKLEAPVEDDELSQFSSVSMDNGTVEEADVILDSQELASFQTTDEKQHKIIGIESEIESVDSHGADSIEIAELGTKDDDNLDNEVDELEEKTTEQTLQEVVAFGNSEQSRAQEGIYVYTLRIDGIDRGDIKNHIHEVLKNSRLKLNADEILATVKKGHLTIRNLNPVKTFIIVNELKGLPLEIYWEQNDITT
ncbi:MAG: hypothetical protein H6625_13980 [Bdellovibrionaceae bacterium]|nr:hypothetical protein [Pseudobdellovibrionaceae bacterium]